MKYFSFLLLLFAFSSNAVELAKGAKIIKIGSTNWNEKVFYVVLSGGVGPCANSAVNFPEVYSQSTVAYAQSHSLAVTAFLHNKTVRIYNYGSRKFKNDDVCTGASLIEIYH